MSVHIIFKVFIVMVKNSSLYQMGLQKKWRHLRWTKN